MWYNNLLRFGLAARTAGAFEFLICVHFRLRIRGDIFNSRWLFDTVP